MSQITAPITKESFPALWRYGVRKQYWGKKKQVLRKVIVPVSQLFYFFAALILTYGVIYTQSQGLLREFVSKAPALVNGWKSLEAAVFAGAATQSRQLTAAALFLYGAPVLFSLVAALAVGLLYHPKAPTLPEAPESQARELWVISQHIKGTKVGKKNSNVFGFCATFYGIGAAGFVVFFLLFYARHPEISHRLVEHLGQASLYFVLGIGGAMLAYFLLNLPLRLVFLLLCSSYVPKAFYENTQRYYEERRLDKFRAPVNPYAPAAPQAAPQTAPAPEAPKAPEQPEAPADPPKAE